MLQDYILKIAPKSFDPDMLWNTELYIWFLLAIFISFSLWITCRIFVRWVGLVRCRLAIGKEYKKTEDLKIVRNKVQEKLPKHMEWGRDAFQTFRLAWEEARLPEEEKAVLPIRIQEFLTPEMVLDSVRNRRIAEALPGIFVALGIFGTFLGLILGLRELEFGKLENLQNGVGHLISGLSLAFLTSLAGIALSIAFSILYRLAINRLERSFFALDALLCRVYPFESQERYARRYFQMQADMKQGLQTLATDVAVQISGAIGPQFGEALQNHLVPVMRDLHSWIEKHIEENRNQQNDIITGFNDHLTRLSKVIAEHFKNSQDRQSEAMEAVLQHYSVQLAETFQNQFEDMGRVIELTTHAQQEIKDQLVVFGEQMQKQFRSQGELIEKTNKAGEVLSQSLESLESIAQKLKLSADDISSAAELLEQSATSAKDGQEVLRETMERQVDTMVKTRQELEGTWREVTDNASSLVSQISHMVQELTASVGDSLVRALDTFDGKVAEVVERFSGTLFEASQTISEMPQIVIGMNESINAISSGINEQKEILGEIKETSKSVVAENIQKAFDASKALGDSANKIGTTAVSMSEFFESFSVKLENGANLFEQRNRQALIDLNRIVTEFTVELQQSHIEKLIAKPVAALCARMDQMVSIIGESDNNGDKEIQKELIEKVTGIDQRVQAVSPGLKHLLARVANVDNAVTKIAISFEKERGEQAKVANVSEKKRSFFGLGIKN